MPLLRRAAVTVVGLGQAGAMLACRLLDQGHHVRAVDARTYGGDKGDQQVPWGWYRKVSLQSPLKRRVTTPDFPFPELHPLVSATYGKMLLTTTHDHVARLWRDWLRDNRGDTDAHVLTPYGASELHGVNASYFARGDRLRGGVFVCDTRDHLIDFQTLNSLLWQRLRDDPKCELLDGTRVTGLSKGCTTQHPVTLHTCGGDIHTSHTVLTLGNRAPRLFDTGRMPVLRIRLPYATIAATPPVKSSAYVSIWNKESSLLRYANGTVKLACGVQSVLTWRSLAAQWRALPHFAAMGWRGRTNLNVNVDDRTMLDRARDELHRLGVSSAETEYDAANVEHCYVDLTPSLCPHIGFVQGLGHHALYLHGLSGSGTMVLDTLFADLVLDSVHNKKMHAKLQPFEPCPSVWGNWFPPSIKNTPLSSVV